MTNQTSNQPLTQPLTQGAHHVGLTVPRLEETLDFFTSTLGFEKVGEKPDYPTVFVSDGHTMITLWQADDGATAFDRRTNVGLHHLALRVQDLAVVAERLGAHPNVAVEFSPEPLGASGANHMMCAIPGGVRVEFIAVP